MPQSKDSALSWIGKHGSERLKKAVIEQGGLRGILEKNLSHRALSNRATGLEGST
jgi:hypothetical protein